jgi:hypothetical protein
MSTKSVKYTFSGIEGQLCGMKMKIFFRGGVFVYFLPNQKVKQITYE